MKRSEEARQWKAQESILARQLAVVERRVQAGDAPHVEAILAEAALAQAIKAGK